MIQKLTESTVEEAALQWLAELGYAVLPGSEIEPEGPQQERVGFGDVILIGSEIPLRPSRQEIEGKMKGPRIQAALSRIGRGDFDRLIDLYMMDEIDLRDYTRGMPLNTDDFPMIEFLAPKSLVLDSENKYRIRNGFEWYKFSKRSGSSARFSGGPFDRSPRDSGH